MKEFVTGIQSYEISDEVPGVSARLTLVIKEGTEFIIDWTVANGLKITHEDGNPVQDSTDNRFEDMNALLHNKSPMYQNSFHSSLQAALMNLQGNVETGEPDFSWDWLSIITPKAR